MPQVCSRRTQTVKRSQVRGSVAFLGRLLARRPGGGDAFPDFPDVRSQLSAGQISERQPRTSHKPEKRTNVSTANKTRDTDARGKYKNKLSGERVAGSERRWDKRDTGRRLVTGIRQIQQLRRLGAKSCHSSGGAARRVYLRDTRTLAACLRCKPLSRGSLQITKAINMFPRYLCKYENI